MKKIQNICLSVILVMSMVLVGINPIGLTVVSAGDVLPAIYLNGITINAQTIELNGFVTISIPVTKGTYDIASVQVSVAEGKDGQYLGAGGEASFNSTTDKYEFNIYGCRYGKVVITQLMVQDLNGNTVYYKNSDSEYDYLEGNPSDVLKNITITVKDDNYNQSDVSGPQIVESTLSLDKAEISLNESVKLVFDANDESQIVDATVDVLEGVDYPGAGGCATETSTGKFEYSIRGEYAGDIVIQAITLCDANGNQTSYYNPSTEGIGTALNKLKDLKCIVTGGSNLDTTGPEIDLSSINIDKTNIGLNDTVTLSVNVSDESGIQSVGVSVNEGINYLGAGGVATDENGDGTYEILIRGNRYGEGIITCIEATDINGNRTRYKSDRDAFAYLDGIESDLSAGDFYVGLSDAQTGIFASGNGFGDNVRLDVETLSQVSDNNIYKQLYEEGYESGGFWNINVTNAFNEGEEKVWLSFPAESYSDGSIFRVRHLLDSGNIENINAIVRNGVGYFQVSSFSPFLVEYSATTDISEAVISGVTDKTYSGNAITQNPTITLNGITLHEGDYSLSYSNNVNVGTATVIVTGKNNFTGEISATFKIKPKSIVPTVTLSQTKYTYDGGEKKPGVTVKDGSTTLKKGTDYTVAYDTDCKKVGKHNVKVTLKGNYSGSKTESYNIVAKNNSGGDVVQTNAMYRLYNPNSGEHFYTASASEKNHLATVGWRYEGVAWNAPKSGSPVYRLYNPNAGDHHYTTSVSEKNHLTSVGWRYEGIGWYSGGSKPLYRAYNPNAIAGSHHYTTSAGEKNNLVSIGWRYEGVAWYGY